MKKFFKKLFNISNNNSETIDLEELKDEIIEEFGPNWEFTRLLRTSYNHPKPNTQSDNI